MEIEYDPWSGEEEPQQPPKRATVQAEARKATKTGNQSRKVYIVCAILIALLMGFFILGKTIYKPAKTTQPVPLRASPTTRATMRKTRTHVSACMRRATRSCIGRVSKAT